MRSDINDFADTNTNGDHVDYSTVYTMIQNSFPNLLPIDVLFIDMYMVSAIYYSKSNFLMLNDTTKTYDLNVRARLE
jgi:hypothetical protein